MYISTKGQAIFIDFAMSIFIFIVVISLFFRYMPQITEQEEKVLDELAIEAKSIASSLVTTGVPESWNSSNVELIGLLDAEGRLNRTKFASLAQIPYEDTKRLLGVRHDYYIYFYREGVLNISGACGSGSSRINNSANGNCTSPDFLIDPQHTIKAERLLIDNNSIVRMVVLSWV